MPQVSSSLYSFSTVLTKKKSHLSKQYPTSQILVEKKIKVKTKIATLETLSNMCRLQVTEFLAGNKAVPAELPKIALRIKDSGTAKTVSPSVSNIAASLAYPVIDALESLQAMSVNSPELLDSPEFLYLQAFLLTVKDVSRLSCSEISYKNKEKITELRADNEVYQSRIDSTK